MTDPAVLLQRHVPHVVYDTQETYFADSAAEWLDCSANQLKNAGGVVLASAQTTPKLSLDFLGTKYPGGTAADPKDAIGCQSRDYQQLYAKLHTQDRYRNRVYGRAVEGAHALWLQYWFFYFYNEAPLDWIKFGRHEGDWEMIQLRLGPGERPDLAVYAQHTYAAALHWADVEKTGSGDTPVVYSARGAHASYFKPGSHWNDRADGGMPGPPPCPRDLPGGRLGAVAGPLGRHQAIAHPPGRQQP